MANGVITTSPDIRSIESPYFTREYLSRLSDKLRLILKEAGAE